MRDLFDEKHAGEPAIQHVENPFPEYLASIATELRRRYTFDREYKRGRTGQTYVLTDRDSNHSYLLKTISQDIREAADRAEVARSLEKECEILRPLKHLCIPSVYASNFGSSIPYYICTFHPGKTWEELRKSNARYTVDESAFAILSIVDALEYLHQTNRTHCDLHLDNLMLGQKILADGVMIIDLGSGHRNTATEPVTADRGGLAFKGTHEIRNYRRNVNRKDTWDAFVKNDIRALGKSLLQMIEVFFSKATHEQRSAYIGFCRLLQDAEISDWREVRTIFDQVLDPQALVSRTEKYFHMEDGNRATIVIPVSGPVPVGEAVLAVINSKTFQWLRGIRQLSFCEYFFPGGTHTRFEHSLGVFKTAIDAVHCLVHDQEFKSRFTQRNVDGFLLAALLHDIGHYPYAHVLEHYVASRIPGDRDAKRLAHHYDYSLHLIENNDDLRQPIDKFWGEEIRHEALRILGRTVKPLCDLLDGPIDCDKLDYLRRDALHCGVQFGNGIDVSGVLGAFRCVQQVDELVVDIKGVQAVEGFVVLQDQILSSVYWNEDIRSLFAMFHAYLAHTIGKDITLLSKLVDDLRRCATDYEAMTKVFLKLPPSKLAKDSGVTQEMLTKLISLHITPNFKQIYRPISRYTSRQEVDPKSPAVQNIYNTIFSTAGYTKATAVPIRWENVKRLRHCYVAALREKKIQVGPIDVLIDVPWGKGTHRIVNVVDEHGHLAPITDVSHLESGIFVNPTAFSAPVRVYTSPGVISVAKKSSDSIRASAEEKFWDKAFKPNETGLD